MRIMAKFESEILQNKAVMAKQRLHILYTIELNILNLYPFQAEMGIQSPFAIQ